MNCVLIVCSTYDAARRKFKDMVKEYGSKVKKALYNRLTIEVDDREYQFISQSSLPEKIIGLTFKSVIIDEAVQLTNEQIMWIMSRRR